MQLDLGWPAIPRLNAGVTDSQLFMCEMGVGTQVRMISWPVLDELICLPALH